MVEQFRGQVKVADIQACFDDLVSRANGLVDEYNAALEAGNLDFSTGSPALAPEGYTLSVGGLKSVLGAYDGYLIGCKPFRSGNNLIITEGRYIASTGVTVIPAGALENFSGLYACYYEPTNTWSQSNVALEGYVNLRVSMNRADYNTYAEMTDVLVDNKKLKVYVGDNGEDAYSKQTIYPGEECFCCHTTRNAEVNYSQYFGGALIYRNYRFSSRNGKTLGVYNAFYKPRGIAFPFSIVALDNGDEVTQRKMQVIKEQ